MEATPPQPPRQAACLVCRRSKIRCDWLPNHNKCKRCIQLDADCVRPAFHVGRRKGIKNKRKGLDKALFKIEQAIRRARTGDQTAEDDKAIRDLQALLGDGGKDAASAAVSASVSGPGGDSGLHRPGPGGRRRSSHSQSMSMDSGGGGGGGGGGLGQQDSSSDEDDELPDAGMGAGTGVGVNGMVVGDNDASPSNADESMGVDDAENPLQLLARASRLELSPNGGGGRAALKRASSGAAGDHHRSSRKRKEHPDEDNIRSFFSPLRVNLDVGEDVDPIDLGLVTEDEAESLFSFFHANLAHTRWGLDPKLYTMAFTRSRSAFLLTSILAASALFLPSAAALSKRLSNHSKTLAHRVMTRRHRSVEIVLAFMFNVPWSFPGQHSTDDEACWYVAMATTIAIDLSLHKVLVPYETLLGGSAPPQVAALNRADCVDPKQALAVDGFGHVAPASDLGRRLLRTRERCWLSLFVLERGMSLARGRSYIVPVTRSLKDCDSWHRSGIADPMDGHLVSMAVLRRNLDGLFATVRSLCDGAQTMSADGSLTAQSIQGVIEKFFDQWFAEWGVTIGSGPHCRLPPYVEILVTHTRLSTYSSVINHPTAPVEVRQFFRSAGLSSALNVMRTAIQGEAQLKSMPNNTTIMISFAACFALTLSGYTSGSSNLAPSVRTLVQETADVLERIGSVTAHRNGLSRLYGNYLRRIVRKAATTAGKPAAAAVEASSRPPAIPENQPPSSLQQQYQQAQHQLQQQHQHQQHVQQAQQAQQAQHQQQQQHIMTTPTLSVASDSLAQQAQHADYLAQAALQPSPLQFSAMSDDQILEVLNQPGNEFDPSFGSLAWADMMTFEGLNWPNLT
ncbi:uncharacterized protein E0L32_000856 [Thyridium curvatum]|uniref:Zn(2)-C6 fungal-type domain-containing protein n=1 Tax=Thyridium curvatum TaxID=1093900 RepID=A0A507B5Q0_9PEZI|nr:uncharacterized protein E0L32_000856 [Thyridium curvatum]TPX12679.1 hypothetical protein E0L32_000856 [Thyridium curvatum]